MAVGISDFIWTKYMASVAAHAALQASTWSTLLIAAGAYVTLSYVEDKRLVIAACLGAFLGTYFGIQ